MPYPPNLGSHKPCYLDCLYWMLTKRWSLGVLERARLSTQRQDTRGSKRAPVSLPKLSTVSWYLSKHFRRGLCYCCARGWVLPLPESAELQLRHFPLKAIHWRGLERRWSPGFRHPRHCQLRCTFSCDYVSHFTLNLCKTGMKLLIYFIWGLWSLINICVYFEMTGTL